MLKAIPTHLDAKYLKGKDNAWDRGREGRWGRQGRDLFVETDPF